MEARNARRWVRGARKPRIGPHGQQVTHRIEATDEEIFDAFARRRYWSAPYLAAYLGRSKQGISRRMSQLAEEGMRYLKLADYHYIKKSNLYIGFLYYERDFECTEYLIDKGIEYTTHEEDGIFAHTLMTDEIMQEIEIGARKHPIIEFDYLPLPRKLPLKEKPDPRRPGKTKKQSQICDEGPFRLMRTDGKKRHFILEADTGSMTIMSGHPGKSAMVRKVSNYIYLIKSGTMTREYGFVPFILTVTRTERHKQSLMKCLEELTKDDKELRRYFLFDTHPVFGKHGYEPNPTGDMLTRPKGPISVRSASICRTAFAALAATRRATMRRRSSHIVATSDNAKLPICWQSISFAVPPSPGSLPPRRRGGARHRKVRSLRLITSSPFTT